MRSMNLGHRVKSVTLADYSAHEVEQMQQGGNQVRWSYWHPTGPHLCGDNSPGQRCPVVFGWRPAAADQSVCSLRHRAAAASGGDSAREAQRQTPAAGESQRAQ